MSLEGSGAAPIPGTIIASIDVGFVGAGTPVAAAVLTAAIDVTFSGSEEPAPLAPAERATFAVFRLWARLRRDYVIELTPRIQGDTALDTLLWWPISDAPNETAYLDATDYTWQVECKPLRYSNIAVPGTWPITGAQITPAVGSLATASLRIAWSIDDLGALTPGTWRLEFTGDDGNGRLAKMQAHQRIMAELV